MTVAKFQEELGRVKNKVIGVKRKLEGAEKSGKSLEGEVKDIGEIFENLEATVEALDNLQCKNNLKIRGSKEKA